MIFHLNFTILFELRPQFNIFIFRELREIKEYADVNFFRFYFVRLLLDKRKERSVEIELRYFLWQRII